MNNRDNIYFWHSAMLSWRHQAAVASLLYFATRDYMPGAKDSAAIRNLLFWCLFVVLLNWPWSLELVSSFKKNGVVKNKGRNAPAVPGAAGSRLARQSRMVCSLWAVCASGSQSGPVQVGP